MEFGVEIFECVRVLSRLRLIRIVELITTMCSGAPPSHDTGLSMSTARRLAKGLSATSRFRIVTLKAAASVNFDTVTQT